MKKYTMFQKLVMACLVVLLALSLVGAGFYAGVTTKNFDNVNVNGNLIVGQKWGASVGGGSIAIGISEASIRPQSPPTNGGVLWVGPGGSLYWMNESGTVTQLAP